MKKILINVDCFGDFDTDAVDHVTRDIVQSLGDDFAVIAYSPVFCERQRYELLQWLVDNGFEAEELILREDNDYSRRGEAILGFLTNIKDVALIIESDARIADSLRDEGFKVWEA